MFCVKCVSRFIDRRSDDRKADVPQTTQKVNAAGAAEGPVESQKMMQEGSFLHTRIAGMHSQPNPSDCDCGRGQSIFFTLVVPMGPVDGPKRDRDRAFAAGAETHHARAPIGLPPGTHMSLPMPSDWSLP